jgi:hypothetical protein
MLKYKLLLIAFLSFALISCDEDEDDTAGTLTINQTNLVGDWTFEKTTINGQESNDFDGFNPTSLNLNENGVCEYHYDSPNELYVGSWSINTSNNVLIFSGTFTQSDESSTTTLSEENEMLVKEVTNNKFILDQSISNTIVLTSYIK